MKLLFLALLLCSPLIARDTIDLYHCYGNDSTLIVEGRVRDERTTKEITKRDTIFTNLRRKLGQIFNDERKDVPLILQVDKNRTFQTKTDDEGYFKFELTFEKGALQPRHPIKLYLKKEPNIEATCRAYILSDQKQIGIISDFDDTVIISNVTNKIKLAYELLLKNYKQREAVQGMAKRYKEILADSPDKPLFFITGSPKQFNHAIHSFLDYHHFPKRTLITKKIHGDNAYSLFKQQHYKSEQIETLLKLYPQIEWILFGDSGEHDREIYLDIAAKYPDKIKAIYIRDVKSGQIEKVYP
jgi:phosphatidate phosphatase APP1